MGRDINPAFDFDGVPAAQAPWEFGEAIASARTDGATGATSLDAKIAARLARRRGAAPKPAAGGSSSDDDDDEARLPGESSDGSDEEGGDDVEASSSEAESDAASSSDDDLPAPRTPRPAAADEGDASSSSDDDGGGGGAARPSKAAAASARHTAAAARAGGALFDAAPAGTAFSAASFESLRLSRPLLKACSALGYARPTPIQAAVIPLALLGRDICGSAVTGSGKTAAFGLPILERLGLRSRRAPATYALILAPARELAAQVHAMLVKLAQFTDVRVALAVGGLSLSAQAAALRARPEIVVATPGRMVDHLRNSHSVGLDDLATLVLDEADRLLDAGFRDEVHQIVRAAPRARQTLLFSATMTAGVRELASLSLRAPVRLAADAAGAAPSTLTHEVVRLRGAGGAGDRDAALLALASRALAKGRAIAFFRTKAAAHRARILFGLAGLPAAAELHGAMTQAARLASLEAFRVGDARFLLATDVAARGLDILGVETVVNADAPAGVSTYLHRAGRTARAGAAGRVVTLAADGDRPLLKAVARAAGVAFTARSLPPAALTKWRDTVASLEPDVGALARAEARETALRKAEMEATKAENTIAHAAEIAARPARTWFASAKEKAATKGAAKEAAAAAAETLEAPAPANAKSRKNEAHKRKRADAKAEAASRKRGALAAASADAAPAIRGAKARARALREQGISPGKAGRMAVAAGGAGSSAKKKRDAKKKIAKAAAAKGGAPAGDGATHAPRAPPLAKVYAGGGRSGKLRTPAGGRTKADAKKFARGGKGAKAFKSKTRHRRR